MMLLLDVGNARIKWGLTHGREISGYGAAVHMGKSLTGVVHTVWADLPPPQRILVANVAGAKAAEDLRRYCGERFKLTPEFAVAVRQACGVTNGYRDPAQLGADRWAAIIAAYVRYRGPACVVDCGTAITVDTVTREGRHLGGLIAPGLGVMRRALAAATAALPEAAGDKVELYARDTRTAIISGVRYAAAAFIERSTAEIRAEHGQDLPVLLTGGDVERLQTLLHGRFTLTPHLVLEGLLVLTGLRT